MNLSIIVVNWNSVDYLRACLASVYQTVREIEFEIIVVDNASGDGCEAMLQREYPEARLIAATRNLGFARANNVGSLHSQGDVLLFLNPDTVVIGDALEKMFRWLQEHPSVGALGACLLNTDGSVQQSCVQPFPTLVNQFVDAHLLRHWFPRWKLWGTWPLLDPEHPAAEFEVDAISGACFMVRRAVFESVGRFTEEYFMYSDDLDLSYKVRHAGYSVVCLSDCFVTHHGGGSLSHRDRSFAGVQYRLAMAQFFRRTRGPLCSAIYRTLVGTAALLRLFLALGSLPFAASVERREGLRDIVTRWRNILWWAVGRNINLEDIGRSHV